MVDQGEVNGWSPELTKGTILVFQGEPYPKSNEKQMEEISWLRR